MHVLVLLTCGCCGLVECGMCVR